MLLILWKWIGKIKKNKKKNVERNQSFWGHMLFDISKVFTVLWVWVEGEILEQTTGENLFEVTGIGVEL